MNQRNKGVLRAPVVVALTVVTSLLSLWDNAAALCCLPLLVFAWALYRGRTWGAFGLLGVSAGLLLLCGVKALPCQVGLAAGLGLASFGLVAPALWRSDALAASVTALSVLGLGLGGALWVARPPDATSLALDYFCTEGGVERSLEVDDDLPYGQRLRPSQLSMDLRPVEDQWLRVLITNNSDRAVALMHPRHGSRHGYLQPYYSVLAQDARGRLLEIVPPPGFTLGTPGRIFTTLLEPGETFSVAISLPDFNGVPAQVALTYGFDPRLLHDVSWAGTMVERRRAALLVGEVHSAWVPLKRSESLPQLKSCF